ncbi:hypothetical protein [Enterobacter cloacae complex sp. ESBL7]|uniref:hypothetical protein n=1 Tax=Enterobacter cloacae complex sp. ESBL7 TaxID=3163325 RepID=UPI003566C7BF
MMSDSFSVVRQAHRICAAYYQQILPVINETAQRLETTFVCWKVWGSDNLPSKRKNPLDPLMYWKWSFLPAMDISFVFSYQQERGTQPSGEDFVLDFRLVTDSEFRMEQFPESYDPHEEPLATELLVSTKDSTSYLNVYLFSVTKDTKTYESPYKLWDNYDGYPKTDSQVHLSDDDNLKAIGFALELKEIAQDDACNLLTEKINAHLARLFAHETKK